MSGVNQAEEKNTTTGVKSVQNYLIENEKVTRPPIQGIVNGTLVGISLFLPDVRRYCMITNSSLVGMLRGPIGKNFAAFQKKAYLNSTAASQREQIEGRVEVSANPPIFSFMLPAVLVGTFTGLVTNYHDRKGLLIRANYYETTHFTFAKERKIVRLGLVSQINKNILTASFLSGYDLTKNYLQQVLPVDQYGGTAALSAALLLGGVNGVVSNAMAVCDIKYRIPKMNIETMTMPGFIAGSRELLKTEGLFGFMKGYRWTAIMSAVAFTAIMLSEEYVVPAIFSDQKRKKENCRNKAMLFQPAQPKQPTPPDANTEATPASQPLKP